MIACTRLRVRRDMDVDELLSIILHYYRALNVISIHINLETASKEKEKEKEEREKKRDRQRRKVK